MLTVFLPRPVLAQDDTGELVNDVKDAIESAYDKLKLLENVSKDLQTAENL